MELSNNVVGWFEIPVADMERAITFYETVLGLKLERNQMGELDMAWFPFAKAPGAPGSLVYFTSHSGDLKNELEKVEPAGGKVLVPKTLIKEDIGYMAVCEDTEGNRIALHSRS